FPCLRLEKRPAEYFAGRFVLLRSRPVPGWEKYAVFLSISQRLNWETKDRMPPGDNSSRRRCSACEGDWLDCGAIYLFLRGGNNDSDVAAGRVVQVVIPACEIIVLCVNFRQVCQVIGAAAVVVPKQNLNLLRDSVLPAVSHGG